MAKDTFWFSHDYDPSGDPKICALIGEYGGFGYGVFWRIIEMLHNDESHRLPLKKYLFIAIAKQMLSDATTIENFLKSCINDYELFVSNGDIFWSNRVDRNIEKKDLIKEKRANAGREGGLAKANAKQNLAFAKQIVAKRSKGEERIGDKMIKEEIREENKKENLNISGSLFATGEEKELFNLVKNIYLDFYEKKCGSGEYYFKPIDGKKIKSILKQLIFKMREKEKSSGQKERENFTSQEISDAALYLLNKGYDTADDWLKANFTLTNIDTKFNSIFTAIKNEGTIKRNGNHHNSNESVVAEILNRVNS